jgi:hypothetical protein
MGQAFASQDYRNRVLVYGIEKFIGQDCNESVAWVQEILSRLDKEILKRGHKMEKIDRLVARSTRAGAYHSLLQQ